MLSLRDDWPILGLAHLRSRRALGRLKELLGKSEGGMKVKIAAAIYQISGDPGMAALALQTTDAITNTHTLIDILYLLPAFNDSRVQARLQSYRLHPEYLVAYNATRALGLPMEEVVQRFRGKAQTVPSAASTSEPLPAASRNLYQRSTSLVHPEPAVPGKVPANGHKLVSQLRLASIILFAISLTQPCYCTGSTCSDSIMVFLLGWAGMFQSAAAWTWLANPLLFSAWMILHRSCRSSMLLATGAFLFSFSFLLFGQVLANESGQSQVITARKAGYWIWLFSCGVMLAATWIAVYRLNLEKRAVRLARGEVSKFN